MAADEYTPLPSEQGYEYGSILPFAQRPIPYANALQPQLAVPGMIREPVNAIASMLQIPGQAVRGELGQTPEELELPALKVAEGMLAAGLGASMPAGYAATAVEHDPFALAPELSSVEAGGRISRALQNEHAREASELGYGRRDTTAISPAQQQIDQMMRQHTVEAVDYDPFAAAKFVKEGGT